MSSSCWHPLYLRDDDDVDMDDKDAYPHLAGDHHDILPDDGVGH